MINQLSQKALATSKARSNSAQTRRGRATTAYLLNQSSLSGQQNASHGDRRTRLYGIPQPALILLRLSGCTNSEAY